MGRNREGVEFPRGGELLLMIGVNECSSKLGKIPQVFPYIETQMSVALLLMILRFVEGGGQIL